MARNVGKKILLTILLIVIASAIAIGSKIALPSEVNVEAFDSIFVKILGFEVVASFYFIMIYTHNAITTLIFGKKSSLSNTQFGLRFGIVFALIYLIGMQEVVIESSPYISWGIDFVIYQFFGGIGEAIATILLCICVSKFVLVKKEHLPREKSITLKAKISAILLVAFAFTLIRTIGYETGLIHSDVVDFPIPCYIWTIIFGIVLGLGFIILLPVFKNAKTNTKLSNRITLLTIGLCWILFNLFIGLIFKGAMIELLIRSGLDVLAIYGATLIWEKYFNNDKIN